MSTSINFFGDFSITFSSLIVQRLYEKHDCTIVFTKIYITSTPLVGEVMSWDPKAVDNDEGIGYAGSYCWTGDGEGRMLGLHGRSRMSSYGG
jgi:hypothetical protein